LVAAQVCAFLEANGHDPALFEEYAVDGVALLGLADADLRVRHHQGLTLVHFSAQLERFVWCRGCA
jgi:hypothetical protein